MTFIKFENDSYCVRGRHRSKTSKIYGAITSKSSQVFTGYCSICNSQKSMTVSDNTTKAEGIDDFFKNLGEKRLYVSKEMSKNVLSNPGRDLDLIAKIATAAVSKKFEEALSSFPELITFYNTGNGLYLGKFV